MQDNENIINNQKSKNNQQSASTESPSRIRGQQAYMNALGMPNSTRSTSRFIELHVQEASPTEPNNKVIGSQENEDIASGERNIMRSDGFDRSQDLLQNNNQIHHDRKVTTNKTGQHNLQEDQNASGVIVDSESESRKNTDNNNSSTIVLKVSTIPQPLNHSMQSGQIMSSNDMINQQHTTNEHQPTQHGRFWVKDSKLTTSDFSHSSMSGGQAMHQGSKNIAFSQSSMQDESLSAHVDNNSQPNFAYATVNNQDNNRKVEPQQELLNVEGQSQHSRFKEASSAHTMSKIPAYGASQIELGIMNAPTDSQKQKQQNPDQSLQLQQPTSHQQMNQNQKFSKPVNGSQKSAHSDPQKQQKGLKRNSSNSEDFENQFTGNSMHSSDRIEFKTESSNTVAHGKSVAIPPTGRFADDFSRTEKDKGYSTKSASQPQRVNFEDAVSPYATKPQISADQGSQGQLLNNAHVKIKKSSNVVNSVNTTSDKLIQNQVEPGATITSLSVNMITSNTTSQQQKTSGGVQAQQQAQISNNNNGNQQNVAVQSSNLNTGSSGSVVNKNKLKHGNYGHQDNQTSVAAKSFIDPIHEEKEDEGDDEASEVQSPHAMMHNPKKKQANNSQTTFTVLLPKLPQVVAPSSSSQKDHQQTEQHRNKSEGSHRFQQVVATHNNTYDEDVISDKATEIDGADDDDDENERSCDEENEEEEEEDDQGEGEEENDDVNAVEEGGFQIDHDDSDEDDDDQDDAGQVNDEELYNASENTSIQKEDVVDGEFKMRINLNNEKDKLDDKRNLLRYKILSKGNRSKALSSVETLNIPKSNALALGLSEPFRQQLSESQTSELSPADDNLRFGVKQSKKRLGGVSSLSQYNLKRHIVDNTEKGDSPSIQQLSAHEIQSQAHSMNTQTQEWHRRKSARRPSCDHDGEDSSCSHLVPIHPTTTHEMMLANNHINQQFSAKSIDGTNSCFDGDTDEQNVSDEQANDDSDKSVSSTSSVSSSELESSNLRMKNNKHQKNKVNKKKKIFVPSTLSSSHQRNENNLCNVLKNAKKVLLIHKTKSGSDKASFLKIKDYKLIQVQDAALSKTPCPTVLLRHRTQQNRQILAKVDTANINHNQVNDRKSAIITLHQINGFKNMQKYLDYADELRKNRSDSCSYNMIDSSDDDDETESNQSIIKGKNRRAALNLERKKEQRKGRFTQVGVDDKDATMPMSLDQSKSSQSQATSSMIQKQTRKKIKKASKVNDGLMSQDSLYSDSSMPRYIKIKPISQKQQTKIKTAQHQSHPGINDQHNTQHKKLHQQSQSTKNHHHPHQKHNHHVNQKNLTNNPNVPFLNHMPPQSQFAANSGSILPCCCQQISQMIMQSQMMQIPAQVYMPQNIQWSSYWNQQQQLYQQMIPPHNQSNGNNFYPYHHNAAVQYQNDKNQNLPQNQCQNCYQNQQRLSYEHHNRHQQRREQLMQNQQEHQIQPTNQGSQNQQHLETVLTKFSSEMRKIQKQIARDNRQIQEQQAQILTMFSDKQQQKRSKKKQKSYHQNQRQAAASILNSQSLKSSFMQSQHQIENLDDDDDTAKSQHDQESSCYQRDQLDDDYVEDGQDYDQNQQMIVKSKYKKDTSKSTKKSKNKHKLL